MSELSTMIAQLEHKPNWVSYEDFLASVDEATHAEWVDGEVVRMTPPTEEHARITLYLAHILSGYNKRKGLGGRVYHAPFLMKLPASAREPDVLYVSGERVPRINNQGLQGPGDLAVEVISPDSRARDRLEKFREYQQEGVQEYWLIDPTKQSVEVYCLNAEGVYQPIPLGSPPRITSGVIPGLWIDVAWLWAEEPDEWAAYEAWGLI